MTIGGLEELGFTVTGTEEANEDAAEDEDDDDDDCGGGGGGGGSKVARGCEGSG